MFLGVGGEFVIHNLNPNRIQDLRMAARSVGGQDNEVETTTVAELLNRYLQEFAIQKRGADPEACRIRALLRHPLTTRFIATVRGVDITRYRDERVQEVTPGSLRRDLTILSQLFEVSQNEWRIYVHNPVRDIKLLAEKSARDRRPQDAQDGSDGEETRLFTACMA